MGGWIERLFGTGPRRLERLEHPRLGELRYDGDFGAWRGTVDLGGSPVGLLVGGDTGPDEALVETALALFQPGGVLHGRLRAFLDEGAREIPPPHDQEIRALRVDEVVVTSPDRPEAAMIFLEGGRDGRVWHCDCTDGVLSGLAADT